MRTIAHFTISLIEALLKCAPIFIIQLLAVYPLVAAGQGQEAMRALLDPAPANISWFIFPLSLSYSCVLTASFLFFLLDRWNYSADDSARAFCRIWVPSVFTLIVGWLWPVAAELGLNHSNVWDTAIGLVNGIGVPLLLGAAWWQTKPVLSRSQVVFFAVAIVGLAGIFILGPARIFYAADVIAITVFCVLIREDFCDGNPDFRPWVTTHSIGFVFAVLFGGAILLLSALSDPWWMFIGTPSIVIWGFSFWVALAFLLTALLSLVSPVLVRLGWMVLVILLFCMPLNHEPLRVLPAGSALSPRLPPSAHFVEWLRARPEIHDAPRPYPVFFIAAQGGGIRAAYWTSTLLAGLEERYPGFTTHIYAISGVSGGSVGGAIYTSMYVDLPARGDMGCSPLVPAGVHGLRPCTAYLFQWDLLGPPLAGLFLNDLPFGWRQVRRAQDLEQGLEYAWAGSMATGRFEEPFQDLWRNRPYHVPSLILNATSADNGHRIVVSNLKARGELTTEPDVEELLGRPIRLSTATFLSARFPVISPVATVELPEGGHFRLVDGGYFNNSGMASIAHLLRTVLPVISMGEFAGRLQPVVLVVSSSPITGASSPGRLAGSLAGALLGPISVLQNTGDAHEFTYLKEVVDLVGDMGVKTDLRPPNDSAEVALGWMLSAETRCKLDQMVNAAINGSDGSAVIGSVLEQDTRHPASWTSCLLP